MEINIDKVSSHLDWLKRKLFLDTISSKAQNRLVKRGQVYTCDLGIGIGSEMQKKRPCVIVQNDIANKKSPNTIVVPITHDTGLYPTMVRITDVVDNNGTLILDGSANASCIVCVSKARLGDLVCTLSSSDMRLIDEVLAKSIDLMHYQAHLQDKLDDKLSYLASVKNERNNAQDKLHEVEAVLNSTDLTNTKIEKIKKIINNT